MDADNESMRNSQYGLLRGLRLSCRLQVPLDIPYLKVMRLLVP